MVAQKDRASRGSGYSVPHWKENPLGGSQERRTRGGLTASNLWVICLLVGVVVLLRMVTSHFNLGDVILEVVSAQSNALAINRHHHRKV
uniref:Uncharacterized protein n=1 Tax=Candidatus Methanogaster sp. ANME-2c ERB4 TaxID=2759911 RepID=A0A7G9YIR8_9EURY|nr:hypothetical protein LLFONJKP_00023 [Methanosarcinales archaeon ANME-2c ERB4]